MTKIDPSRHHMREIARVLAGLGFWVTLDFPGNIFAVDGIALPVRGAATPGSVAAALESFYARAVMSVR